MDTIKTILIGAGNISGIYLKNITGMFPEVELIGVYDQAPQRAEAARQAYGIPKAYATLEQALADEKGQLILNLTPPAAHFSVSREALLAGKHVYCEKPLGISLEEGRALSALAREKGLRLGGAPDTFLGAGIQTCRKLIDDGKIGDIVGASAFMLCRGHEGWHPDPMFYYQQGGGPMMDMGPYYLTALMYLLGGVRRVFGAGRITFPKRKIFSQPRAGQIMDVTVNTHMAGTIEFASGAIGTILTTFDVHYPKEKTRYIEIYGSEGSLFLPDPNFFDGPVLLFRPGEGLREMPLIPGYRENARGLGLWDMARAIRDGSPARCDVQQTLHVLEVMAGFEESAKTGSWTDIQSLYRQPPLLQIE